MNFNNHVGLASSYLVAGGDAMAAAIFERAASERPNAWWIYRSLAPALLGAGRVEEARRAIAVAQRQFPGFSIRRFREGMVFSEPVMDRVAQQLRDLGIPEG